MANDEVITEATSLFPVVAAALIGDAGHVLLQRRSPGSAMAGLWEFPGGKMEAGETPEAALVRELREELDIGVAQATLAPLAFASAPLGARHLLLLLYLTREWTGRPRPLAASELRWVRPAEMRDLAMPPADRPLVAMLERLIG
jgi:8-oxo-dGTP diphosphatase